SMPARSSFDYAVVRVVPNLDRGEFVNVGVILYCRQRRFLAARLEPDYARLAALAPDLDLDELAAHLAAIPRICQGGHEAGPIGELSLSERWHWLVAPRSTAIQVSPVHSGLGDDPGRTLEHLMEQLVRPIRSARAGG